MMPTISVEDNECVSKMVSSFVFEIADSLLLFSKHRDRSTASQLIKLLTDMSFDLSLQKQYMKALWTANKPAL